MIKISILTCTYNSESTINSTLQSVLCQEYDDVEHIIVDGASTDSTLQKAEEYKRQSDFSSSGHEVVILSEPDNGLYFAMNKALKMASGDYVVYLNAGDFLPDSRVVADIAECATQSDRLPGVIYGDTDLVDLSGNFLRHRRLSPPKRLTSRSFADGMLVCHQAFYALTSLARAIPYNIDYRYSADVDWCIRVMKAAEREGRSLRCVGRVVVNYLSEGMTTQNHKASLCERFRVMRSHYGLPLTLWKHFCFIIRSVFKR